MSLSQGLYQKQLQKLSPQQIQLMKLLQIPTAQLDERIKEELEENPALEPVMKKKKRSLKMIPPPNLKKKQRARKNLMKEMAVKMSMIK